MKMRLLAVVSAILFALPGGLGAADRRFLSGYAGTLPARESDKARAYFEKPAVRQLLASLETGSLTAAEVNKALETSGVTLNDLLRVRILRSSGDRFSIGFAYFTAADMRKIAEVVQRVAPTLASAYRSREKEFNAIFRTYPSRAVSQKEIAFVLLAGFCLNWDGLEVTSEIGLRRPILVEGDGFKYSFWASEELPGGDYREIYWGSSTFPGPAPNSPRNDAYSFSSFGDAVSDPRMNLPDLLYLSANELPANVREKVERVGLHDSEEMGQHFERVLGGELLGPISRGLFALRRGPSTATQLRPIFGRDPAPILDLLEEIQYVDRDRAGAYHLRVPVLDDDDRAIVEKTIGLSREVMRAWFEKRVPELRRDLGDLTAVRAGLPFEAVFTQVWHEIFGDVTRDLARSGFIATAYAPTVRFKGSFSVLWRQSLYRFLPG
jgi:hypothetical protein